MTTQRIVNQRGRTPSAAERQKAAASMWQERGYSDARIGRTRDRESVRALGGDVAVSAYFGGHRLGKRRLP